MEFLSKTQVITAFGAVALAVIVLELVRRRRLAEEYSFLWIVSSAVAAVLGFWTPALRTMTRALGILNESSMVFLVGLAFGTTMLLYLSVRLTRLGREHAEAVRELALVRGELESLRDGGGAKGTR
jgi:hypothetical protein